jgi:peptidylprolyl isomerase
VFTLKPLHLIALAGATMLTAWGSLNGAPLQAPAANNQVEANQKGQLPAGFTQSEINKLSEAFGHFIGRNLNNPGVHFDLESIIRGIRAGYAGQPAPMSDQEYEKLMTKLQESAFQQLSQENLKAADAYLDKNKSVDGMIQVEPGKLQYLVLKQGSGTEVKGDGVPQINYVGKYIDGTVFGSSEEVGGPITIPLSQTIKGFSKGLAGMKEGEKRRLFVHPDLGYGTSGQLPPNALLIFDIEVVKADTPNYKGNSTSSLSGKTKLGEDDEDDDDDQSDDDDDSDDDRLF